MPRRKPDNYLIESALHERGLRFVAGIDEAGRGPLAGPVCAAAVVFEPGTYIPGVTDSKLLLPEQRDELYDLVMERALTVGVGLATVEEIDTINILQATKLAVRRAIRKLTLIPDYLVLDALRIPGITIQQEAFVKGDLRCFSIGAASIIAKVTRDRLMVRYAQDFPGYGFQNHKGYATPDHRRAIGQHGLCTLHRQTFVEQWFEMPAPRASNTHDQLYHRLNCCNCTLELTKLCEELTSLRGYLPKAEYTQLSTVLHQRLNHLHKAGTSHMTV